MYCYSSRNVSLRIRTACKDIHPNNPNKHRSLLLGRPLGEAFWTSLSWTCDVRTALLCPLKLDIAVRRCLPTFVTPKMPSTTLSRHKGDHRSAISSLTPRCTFPTDSLRVCKFQQQVHSQCLRSQNGLQYTVSATMPLTAEDSHYTPD